MITVCASLNSIIGAFVVVDVVDCIVVDPVVVVAVGLGAESDDEPCVLDGLVDDDDDSNDEDDDDEEEDDEDDDDDDDEEEDDEEEKSSDCLFDTATRREKEKKRMNRE